MKIKLFGDKNGSATLEMNRADRVIMDKALHESGAAQMFHTQNVLRRIKKYMPFLTGALYKITMIQTNIRNPEIVTDVPQAKYLFYGKVMVDPKTNAAGFMTPEGWRSRRGCVKVLTDRNLEYTRTKNANVTAHWDRTLSANEGKAMVEDLQRFVNRGNNQK